MGLTGLIPFMIFEGNNAYEKELNCICSFYKSCIHYS